MNNRLPNSRAPNDCGASSQSRKSKKRSNKRNSSTNDSWYNNDRDRDSHEPSEDEVPGMEYTSMFWQHPRLPHSQPHPVHNGQRLFTAMSDPSVCGYSAVPITYAMEPVSIPPMYRIYPPMVRPNYRPYGRGRSKSTLIRAQNGPSCPNDSLGNGYSSLQENGWSRSVPMAYQNGDYASLPPTANMDNKESTEELSSEHRRYSDPGLGPANVPTNSKSEDTDSVDSGSSITTIGKSNKLFLTLIEQMTKLKETNSQLFKELHQTKSDLEIVKTELSQLKQSVPLEYQPGMLSDIIKEIRDASKIKEETMLSKMKLLMESQHFQKSVDVDQLKNQLEKMEREKAESEERIDKLEKKVATLRMSLNGESREIVAFEEENLALRRELQEARASRSLAEIQSTKLDERLQMHSSVLQRDIPSSSILMAADGKTNFRNIETHGIDDDDDDDDDSSSGDTSDDEPEQAFVDADVGSPKSNSSSNNSVAPSGPVTDL